MSTPTSTSTGPDEPRSSSLLKLPPEILARIIKHAETKHDLMNIRLASKQLAAHSTRELFREVLLTPEDESVESLASIAGDEHMRRMPRRVAIRSQAHAASWDITDGELFDILGDSEDDSDALRAVGLPALARLPNADAVEVEFSPACAGEDDSDRWAGFVESLDQRREMLRLTLQAVADRAKVLVEQEEEEEDGGAGRHVRSLTIINLQNDPDPDIARSESFRGVAGRLEELHLATCQQSIADGPDHDYDQVELLTFPPHLCADWLLPMSSNLRALSLYHSENWGPFPGRYDFSDLSFPNLETLSLGQYTIAHDDQLDWVFRQESLKTLILHNCMIVPRMRIWREDQENWKLSKQGWHALPRGVEHGDGSTRAEREAEECEFGYDGRWSRFFDRIGDELPSLVDFRFDFHGWCGSDAKDIIYSVRNRQGCGARVFPQRYIVFDRGLLPSPWLEADHDGENESWLYDWQGREPMCPNFHEQHLDGDQASLERLLDKCRQRARASR